MNTEIVPIEESAATLAAVIDPKTGDAIYQRPEEHEEYQGISRLMLTPEQSALLLAPIPEEIVEIRPDGLIFLPNIHYRNILNKAIGPGVWSLLPKEIRVLEANVFYIGQMYINGCYVSESIGEAKYFQNNDRSSYATAVESAKSNCLMRCCKDLGIASECWDPVFIRSWIDKWAVQVWVTNIGNGGDAGKRRMQWRRADAEPINQFPWRETKQDGQGGGR